MGEGGLVAMTIIDQVKLSKTNVTHCEKNTIFYP